MSPVTDKAKEVAALMEKLLAQLDLEKIDHAVAIDALANLAYRLARIHSCCRESAGLMLIEMGTKLALVPKLGQLSEPVSHPSSKHLH